MPTHGAAADADAYPTAHVHETGCAAAPAQYDPATHAVHDALAPAQLVTAPATETYPLVHVHATGCAAAPAQELPAVQITHDTLAPAQLETAPAGE